MTEKKCLKCDTIINTKSEEIKLCCICNKFYKTCFKCLKTYRKDYFKRHGCYFIEKTFTNNNVSQSSGCKICKKVDVEFKKASRVCRICYNLKQREKVKCRVCEKSISCGYYSKHLKFQHHEGRRCYT